MSMTVSVVRELEASDSVVLDLISQGCIECRAHADVREDPRQCSLWPRRSVHKLYRECLVSLLISQDSERKSDLS